MPRRWFALSILSGVFACWMDVGGGTNASEKLDLSKLPPASNRKVDYIKDIQPLLKKNCYSCHGAETQESGLRLDVKQRAMEGGDSGAALVVGKSSESRLVHFLAALDKKKGRMPPDDSGTALTPEQIGLVRAWIDQGLAWPDETEVAKQASQHWSFQQIARPSVPVVRNQVWVTNPIDAFILARLEKASLAPSPAADKTTLIRRVYLDLLGLPPTPAEVDAFVHDDAAGAFERLLDRVFASPHYGERWGRHWLDQARYADSDGYEKDKPRPYAWRFRNWVIDAVNADLPFDRFSIEQLAGDLLPAASASPKLAVGFHRNTLHNTEGGADQEEDRVKKTVDRTNTLGTVWLGLSVGCAQCHTHKYDPITQREYFSLYAFFNNLNEADIDTPSAADVAKLAADTAKHTAELAKLEAAVTHYEQNKTPAAQAEWEKSAANFTAWETLDVQAVSSAKGGKLTKQPDDSWLASGKSELSDTYTVTSTSKLANITALRLETLPDASLPANGPGRSKNGNFVLSEFRAEVAPAEPGKLGGLVFRRAEADFEQSAEWKVETAIDNKPNTKKTTGWAISPQFGKPHTALFELSAPLTLKAGETLTIRLEQKYKGPDPHNIGRFRISATNGPTPVTLQGTAPAILEIAKLPAAQRSPDQAKKLSEYFRTIDPDYLKLKAAVADFVAKAPKLSADLKAQSVTELAKPRDTRIQLRGDFLSPGDSVSPTTFAVLPPLKPRTKQPDRADLAQWLFDPANPLTARVTANRIWQNCFTRGLVTTGEDFGKQGEPPSHPELLDWLASEFRDHGWSAKHLHRLIVTSATYQQSSAPRSDLTAVDPENVLVARQVRRRVEAELVRDVALAASGLLDRRIGGPSVRPPQPAEHSKLTYAGGASWATSTGGDAYRRGMYTFFQRTSPYPMLMTFDSPDSTETCTRRVQSNTPLQALTLWNDPVLIDVFQAFARVIVTEASDSVQARATFAFRKCVSREPTPEELNEVLSLFGSQLALLQANAPAAVAISGKRPAPPGTQPADLAAWTLVARTLMNLDEFITRE